VTTDEQYVAGLRSSADKILAGIRSNDGATEDERDTMARICLEAGRTYEKAADLVDSEDAHNMLLKMALEMAVEAVKLSRPPSAIDA
jgi:hypothetical protein